MLEDLVVCSCGFLGVYQGMAREGDRYRIALRCPGCGRFWNALTTTEEAHRLRSPTPPGVPVAVGTEVTVRAGTPQAVRAKPKMRLVFLSAPVRPIEGETIESNLERARGMYRRLCLHHKGVAFVAPWILNCEVFDETPENIAAGMRRNMRVIEACDELWLLGNRLSKGMGEEAKHARAVGKIVRAVGWGAVEAEEWKEKA